MCRGKEEKRDQNCSSANQKTQLSFSISTGKTQRAALMQGISGLDQNNYGIISSSDNPRLIPLWFACRIGSEENQASRCSHHADWGAGCADDWKMGASVRKRQNDTFEKNVSALKLSSITLLKTFWELLHRLLLFAEDEGSRRRNYFCFPPACTVRSDQSWIKYPKAVLE